MQEQQLAASSDARVPDITAGVDALPIDPAPELLTPKTHQRAGITKNHNRGQSKQRRKMAAASRRRNR